MAKYFACGFYRLFGIVAMVDFWKWEYDYGHNLDPNAAIKSSGYVISAAINRILSNC